jgi:hypothetical protein
VQSNFTEESLVVDVNLLITESSPETADTDTSVSQTPCGHRNLEFYNKKFGTTKSNSIGITTSRSWDSPPPSPRGRLGAGRVDPFLSFPLKKPDPDIHNALDLCK